MRPYAARFVLVSSLAAALAIALPPSASAASIDQTCAPAPGDAPSRADSAAPADRGDTPGADEPMVIEDDEDATEPAPAAGGTAPPEPVAVPPPAATAAEALGRTPKRVKCLDESLIDESGRARRRKGVQPRRFRKAKRLAISVGGGGWAGDLLDTSWHAHGNVAFWPTEGFGIDVDFKLTSMTYRLERSATGFTGQNRYPDGIAENFAYVGMGHLLFAPLHTKQRARKDRVAHGDFVLFAGAGRAFHPSVQGAGFDLGMSLYWYVTRFVSLRVDVSDVILAQEAFGSRRISNNLVFSTGVGLWIPFRRKG